MIDGSLIDWSRAQFALTAMYHWLFVPLTLGLAIIMGIMESLYVVRKDEFWKRAAQFWMKLFGINFAVGVATGIILEFEFGTNWSNYSWLVGDIFGAPLAIEGILAFFMEATFIAVMFFGWNKVSKRAHLAATWLTGLGATFSAWWILVANAWMQYPVGMSFNPETVRNEMTDFWAVAFSPMAVDKFLHSVWSGWVVGAAFVVGVSGWYMLRNRHRRFALSSIRIGSIVGLVAALLVVWSGDRSAVRVAQVQPMKLAAAEGLHQGGHGVPFSIVEGVGIPKLLSFLATHDMDGYVPGIDNLLEGGYVQPDGTTALSADEKIARGKKALDAFSRFKKAQQEGDPAAVAAARDTLNRYVDCFGYGYLDHKEELVPHIPLIFWAFRAMVGAGGFLICFFAFALWVAWKERATCIRWMAWIGFLAVPVAYAAGQAGWIVAEVGRQPWAIQDQLPLKAAVSAIPAESVQLTFWIFAVLFTILLVAEVRIMLGAIRKGPDVAEHEQNGY